MASPWQYNYPGERKPAVSTDRGYHVNLPDGGRGRANEERYTAYVEDDTGTRRYMFVHEITMNFELAGSYAQSPQFRAFYPRNFVQPRITITGQTASQADYANLTEFIRKCQRQALTGSDFTTTLVIPQGGPGKSSHDYVGHHLQGHIERIERKAERWVNAPEFSFEFVVVTASAGLYHTATTDASGVKDTINQYMRFNVDQQIRNRLNKPSWAIDPDKGSGAAGYDKGTGAD